MICSVFWLKAKNFQNLQSYFAVSKLIMCHQFFAHHIQRKLAGSTSLVGFFKDASLELLDHLLHQ